jgi:ankyrin repeat protein
MTPLMNTVTTNNLPSFVYLFFKEHCHLNHVDIYGNTLMHLAAKSNAVNIAKILKHLYKEGKD